jgi:ubiquinone/menaquinone biosynthesis C-methylase UbiE
MGKDAGELKWQEHDFGLYPDGETYLAVRRKCGFELMLKMFPDLIEHRNEAGLDLGCGIVSLYDNTEFTDITAVDPLLSSYNKIYTPTNTNVRYDYNYRDDGILPFEDGSFTFVTCLNVIDHTVHHKELIGEIHRVLKPNGCLYLWVNFCDTLWLPEHVKLWNIGVIREEFSNFQLLSDTTVRLEKEKTFQYWGIFKK